MGGVGSVRAGAQEQNRTDYAGGTLKVYSTSDGCFGGNCGAGGAEIRNSCKYTHNGTVDGKACVSQCDIACGVVIQQKTGEGLRDGQIVCTAITPASKRNQWSFGDYFLVTGGG